MRRLAYELVKWKNKMIDLFPYEIYIDACAFWPPHSDEKKAAEELFRLNKENVIVLQASQTTEEEMEKAPHRARTMVKDIMFSSDIPQALEEKRMESEIKKWLFPTKKILSESDKKDVRNIYCANSWGASMFVTFDIKHILNKADVIKHKTGMHVVSPTQCLKKVLDRMEGIEDKDMREY